MGHETPTEPGGYPLRAVKKNKPWWAVALLSGFGAGVALAGALGLSSMQAHGQEQPPVRSGGMSLPPGSISLDQRLVNIETALKALTDEVTAVKLRLPPKKP